MDILIDQDGNIVPVDGENTQGLESHRRNICFVEKFLQQAIFLAEIKECVDPTHWSTDYIC